MDISKIVHKGILTFLSIDSGVGVIRESERKHTFSYSQIASYKGQTFKELGFKEGKEMEFEIGENGEADKIRLSG